MAGACVGYIGGAVADSAVTTPALGNPDGMTIAAVKATMPAVSGTFAGFGGVVGSNDPAGDQTNVIFGLYANSGGMPGALLIDTSNSVVTFDDPSSPEAVQPGGYISDQSGGFSTTLAANSTYWVYIKEVESSSVNDETVGVSTATTICRSGWINYSPPIAFTDGSSAATCVAPYQAYMIVSFP